MTTIVEAIQHVMRANQRPMSAGEICQAIQEAGLYTFRAAHPAHIVQTQLRRHCVDSPAEVRAKVSLFTKVDDRKFSLLETPQSR